MKNKQLKCFAKNLYKDFSDKILVYLPSGKTKNANYDKFRDVGYTITSQNALVVDAMIRDVRPEELLMKDLGQVVSSAIKIVVSDQDANLIKLSNRITIDSVEYYVYNDAVGNKFQLLGSQFGNSTIMIFRKEI